MPYQCFVCDQTFKRSQDRSTHLRQQRDTSHQQYLFQQKQSVTHQFTQMLHAAASVAAHVLSTRSSVLEAPLIQINDMDQDDLPSSQNMDIDYGEDQDSFLDNEVAINSEPDEVVEESEDKEDEIALSEAMAMAAAMLNTADLDDIADVFDFLPDPDLEVAEEAGTSRSNTADQSVRRTLIDDDAESRIYQWHPTAGQIYQQEPTVHTRWQSLFAVDNNVNQGYHPFSSRLDWEVAQWAVKEKITQKSFDRFLKIPQVMLWVLVANK